MKNEKDGSRLGIIILVVVSLVFIGLASVAVIFISAKIKENEAAKVEKARQNRQALGELAAVSDQINQELRDKIGKEDAVEGSAEKAKQLEEAMGKAASKATGDNAKAMLAGQRLMGSMQGHVAAYEKAYSAFMAKGGAAPASLTSVDDIMGQTLRLLQSEWGNWKVNEAGITVFQNTAALKSFKDLQSQIKEVCERQMQLQQKLLQPKPARPDAAKLLQSKQ
jgi:hypothetical protein